MLRRQKQIRVQVQKLLDGALFGLALWMAYYIRQNYLRIQFMGGTPEIEPLDRFFWLILIIIPIAPFLLETQGFYNRPLLPRRRSTLWALLKASTIGTIVLISLVFIYKQYPARSVILLFAPISV